MANCRHMPSASAIRNQLLHTLDESVIPAVSSPEKLPMVLGSLPMHLPDGVGVTHLPIPPLSDAGPTVNSFGQRWEDALVSNYHYRSFWIVCEGVADIRMGVTESMAKVAGSDDDWTRFGCHILHLPAPTLVQLPAGVPYSDGTHPHWEREEASPSLIKIFWVRLLPKGAMCHLCSTRNGRHEPSHPLMINDSSLASCISMMEQELQMREQHYQTVTKSLLLSLILRIRRRLTLDEPEIINTAWLPEPELNPRCASGDSSANAHQIIKEADDFIQTHLSEPITLPGIAAYCGISPTHLNRIFNNVMGVSVKRYVNRRRVGAAKGILEKTNRPIREIANLVGFSQASHFCQVFQQIEKMSPTQYREQVKRVAELSVPEDVPDSPEANSAQNEA